MRPLSFVYGFIFCVAGILLCGQAIDHVHAGDPDNEKFDRIAGPLLLALGFYRIGRGVGIFRGFMSFIYTLILGFLAGLAFDHSFKSAAH